MGYITLHEVLLHFYMFCSLVFCEIEFSCVKYDDDDDDDQTRNIMVFSPLNDKKVVG